MELLITTNKNKVSLIDRAKRGGYNLGSVECALGNIISVLDDEFQNEPFLYTGDDIVTYLTDKFNGKKENKIINIWGMYISSGELHFIRSWFIDDFDNKEKITLTNEMIEVMRIKGHIKTSRFPVNQLDYSEGDRFEVQNIKEVIYALLYYYSLNNFKLVKCEHCGRWFVTSTFKKRFCPRNSLIDGYTHLNCEQAVRNIKQTIKRKKDVIYASMTMYQQNYGNDEVNKFLDDYAQYSDRIKKQQSAQNLLECLNFLTQFRREQKNGNHNPTNQ